MLLRCTCGSPGSSGGSGSSNRSPLSFVDLFHDLQHATDLFQGHVGVVVGQAGLGREARAPVHEHGQVVPSGAPSVQLDTAVAIAGCTLWRENTMLSVSGFSNGLFCHPRDTIIPYIMQLCNLYILNSWRAHIATKLQLWQSLTKTLTKTKSTVCFCLQLVIETFNYVSVRGFLKFV